MKFEEEIFNIFDVSNGNNDYYFYACSGEELLIISYNRSDNKFINKKFIIEKNNCYFCLKLNSYFLICGQNGAFIYEDINNKPQKLVNGDESFIGGIKINDDMFALISNSSFQNGKNIIKFYIKNYNPKLQKNYFKLIKEIEGYKFIPSSNSLTLIPFEEGNIKVLLCACKENTNKNYGILLILLQENEKIIYHEFYKTNSFEVYCFCPINIFENNNIFNKNNYNTQFFLIGSFDHKKRVGSIKLCKIIITKSLPKIKFFEDNICNGFNKFNGPITCITQNINNGIIYIVCNSIYYFQFKSI